VGILVVEDEPRMAGPLRRALSAIVAAIARRHVGTSAPRTRPTTPTAARS
jgi:hypothetical protein